MSAILNIKHNTDGSKLLSLSCRCQKNVAESTYKTSPHLYKIGEETRCATHDKSKSGAPKREQPGAHALQELIRDIAVMRQSIHSPNKTVSTSAKLTLARFEREYQLRTGSPCPK